MYFQLVCLPKNGDKIGAAVEVISQNKVQSGPLQDPFKEKHALTAKRLENDQQFRVVSYNLLADYYCGSEYSHKELFPYCPAYALEIDYRKLLCMREMLGYNADIYCLQEVDAKVFDLDLTVYMGDIGLDGKMQKKGLNAEGVATFYRRDKFDLVNNFGINLNEQMEDKPYFAELYDKIKKNTKLCERMRLLATAVQVCINFWMTFIIQLSLTIMELLISDVGDGVEVKIERSIFIGWKYSPLFPSRC